MSFCHKVRSGSNGFVAARQGKIPEFGEQIDRCYLVDHEFRSLCHDYGVCVEELSKGRNTSKREGELRELAADLEIDITEYLTSLKNKAQ